MKRYLLPLLLTFISLASGMSLYAAAEPICAGQLGSSNNIALTRWETDATTGDVLITIYNRGEAADEAKPTRWRDRGMAEDITTGSGWALFIDNTEVDISEYFEKEYTKPTSQATAPAVYKLKLKAGKTVPTGSIIDFHKTHTASKNICWWTPTATNAYGKYSFEYEYGSTCASDITAPENIALSNTNVLTFDAVSGAESYNLYIYYLGTLIHSQEITSGTTLTRPMMLGGTYVLKLTAVDENSTESDESEGLDWVLSDLSTDEADLESSEYCSYSIGSGTGLAAMTWETDEDGNIKISISGDASTTWRGTAFKGVANFKVGNVNASAFFTENYTTNTTIYQLKKKSGVIIALGDTITFNGDVQWKTENSGNAYLLGQKYKYTYGTVCNEPDVLTTYTLSCGQEIIAVGGNVALTLTSLNQKGTAMDVTTEYTISPSDAGHITNGVYYADKKGLVTITATGQKDEADEKSSEIHLFAYPTPNLAKAKAVECNDGAYDSWIGQANNSPINTPALIVNEKLGDNNYWQGYPLNEGNTGDHDAWVIIDLEKVYDIDLVQVCFFGNASSKKYRLDFSIDKSDWTTAYSYNKTETTRDRKDNWYSNTTDNKEVRYVRFFSEEVNTTANANGLKLAEIYVYGELSADTEAPVMVSASYSDVTINSVVISVSATDNTVVTGYRLKGDKTGDYTATDGAFTVDGLLSGKTYSINVYALDQAGNESANYKTVTFTTEGDTPVAGAVNLAEGKTATAGSSEGGNTADKAVDGDKTSANSRWGNYGKVADAPENNWWQVDLAKAYSLDSVKITWQHYPDYNGIVIRGSYDGSHWFDIVDTGEKYATNAVQTIEMPEGAAARYVRIANRTGSGTSKWFMSFYEFEVYGTGGTYVMNLTENSDNSANITEFNNATVVATLDRSFLAGTDWYTLCLPFDMSDSQLKATFGAAYRLGKLVGSYWKGAESLFLEFDYVNHLEAGMPYVMRPSQDTVFPVISNVVVNAAPPIENRQGTAATMVGIYGPYQIPSDYYFLGANNYLLQNNNGSSMRGFRAYFKFEQQLPGNARARIVMRSDQTTIATSLEQTIKPVQAEKFFQNGQLLIRKNGTIYTVLGIKAE